MKIIRTPPPNLAFPDIISRNVMIDEYQHHQLQQKKPPGDIQFFDEHGHQIIYKINHDDTETIFIPSIANNAGNRRYYDCKMMVKIYLLTA